MNVVDIFSEIYVLRKIARYGCTQRLLCFHDYFTDVEKQHVSIVTEAYDGASTLAEFMIDLKKKKQCCQEMT